MVKGRTLPPTPGKPAVPLLSTLSNGQRSANTNTLVDDSIQLNRGGKRGGQSEKGKKRKKKTGTPTQAHPRGLNHQFREWICIPQTAIRPANFPRWQGPRFGGMWCSLLPHFLLFDFTFAAYAGLILEMHMDSELSDPESDVDGVEHWQQGSSVNERLREPAVAPAGGVEYNLDDELLGGLVRARPRAPTRAAHLKQPNRALPLPRSRKVDTIARSPVPLFASPPPALLLPPARSKSSPVPCPTDW